MNKIEQAVLDVLNTNARTSVADIAKQTGLSEKQVTTTMKQLERRGVILQYIPVLNEEKLSDTNCLPAQALIEIQVRPEKKFGFEKLARRICRYPNVIDHYLISGRYDFLILVEGQSLQEISSFVAEKLACLENVKSTATHFILRKYKVNGIATQIETQPERLIVTP